MKSLKIILLFIVPLLYLNCGNPVVDITNAEYIPKIAVQAYLFAGEQVNNIRIMRNFPLNTQLNLNNIYLTPSGDKVVVTINDNPLIFDPVRQVYFNSGITIENNKTYTLKVSAVIDGKQLYTTSTTIVPNKGFSIVSPKNLGDIKYGKDSIQFNFTASPGSDLYVFAFLADTANLINFIYDNLYSPNLDSNKVKDRFANYLNRHDVVNDINSYTNTVYTHQVEYNKIWFYSSYKTFVYAGDQNFKDFLFSAPEVKEFDGNFHEPVQIFTGDGIGVFASAIRDTITFRIIP